MLHDGFTFPQERVGPCTVTLSIDLSYLMSLVGLDLLITWRLLKAGPKYLLETVWVACFPLSQHRDVAQHMCLN